MADDNKIKDDDKNARKLGGGKMQPGTIAVWIAIIAIMGFLFSMKGKFGQTPPAKLTHFDFMQKVNSNLIASAKINYGSPTTYLTEVRGNYFEVDKNTGEKILGADGKAKEIPFLAEARLTETIENKLLAVEVISPHENSAVYLNIVSSALLICP